MSVGLSRCLSKVAEVVDDLESFMHVVIYYAVRYLRSNVPDVPGWLENYFDLFLIYDGQYLCSPAKERSVLNGELEATATVPLHFGSPIDNLLLHLIRSFRSYYIEKAYDEYMKSHEDSSPPSFQFPSPSQLPTGSNAHERPSLPKPSKDCLSVPPSPSPPSNLSHTSNPLFDEGHVKQDEDSVTNEEDIDLEDLPLYGGHEIGRAHV